MLYIIIAASVIASISWWFLRPVVAEGVVDHKGITGTRFEAQHTIATITDTGVHVDDEELRSLLQSTEAIDDTVENQIRNRYTNIRYLVSVRTGGETMAHFTSREDFNRVNPGDRIRYQILRFERSTIRIRMVLG